MRGKPLHNADIDRRIGWGNPGEEGLIRVEGILNEVIEIFSGARSTMDALFQIWKLFDERISIFFARRRKDALVVDVLTNVPSIRKLTVSKGRKSLLWYVVDTGEEVYLQNFLEFSRGEYRVSIPVRVNGEYSFFGIPLKVNDEVAGALAIVMEGRDSIDEDIKEIFRMVAKLLSILFKVEREKGGKIDSLTGALSRDYFYNEFLRTEEKFDSLLVVDIKGLSTINETLGYWKGDQIVKTASDVLRNHMGKEDVIVRLGEDELLVLFKKEPDIDSIVSDLSKSLERKTGIPVDFSYGYSKIMSSIESAIIEATSNMKLKKFEVQDFTGIEYAEITEKDIERFEKSNKGIAIHTIEEILYVNEAILKLVGLKSKKDLSKYHALSFTAPEYKEIAYRRAKLVLETGMKLPPAIEKGFTVSGEPITVVVNTIPVIFKGRKAVMITVEDITVYTLREASSKFANMLSRMIEDFLALDIDAYGVIFETVQNIFPDMNLALVEVAGKSTRFVYAKFRDETMENEEFDPEDLGGMREVLYSESEKYIPDLKPSGPFEFAGEIASIFVYPMNIENSKMMFIGIKSGYDTMKPFEMDLIRTIAKHIERRKNLERILKDLEVQKEKYMELAFKDSLTGAYTRAFLNEWLRTFQSKQERLKENSSLVVMDIDCLKEVNDNFGHEKGDELLVEFAKSVLENIRKMDIFARWGGDEFVLILPGTPEEAAKEIVRRISEKTGSSFSYGISEFGYEKSFQEAFREADEELYRMKRMRDCRSVISEFQRARS